MNSSTFNYLSVRTFLRQLLLEDRFKKITPPDYIKNKYFVDNKYAFYLGVDAIIKYEQIIEDNNLLDEYVCELNKIFRKFTDYTHIINGVNQLLSRVVSIKLELNNVYMFASREKILRYIYNKYIVDGYFYFGFSSNYSNEIECVGIKSNTFFIDDKLKYINNLFKQNSGKYLFLNDSTTITDDITIATYFALISPYYLADLISNPLFKEKSIDRECFYTHNLIKIKEQLIKVCDYENIDEFNKKEVVKRFIDCYTLSCRRGIKPCIAKIKRASIRKNRLKDIDEIINNTDEKLSSAIGLILDSRYTSYLINDTISPSDIEIIELPTYQEFLSESINLIPTSRSLEIETEEIKSKKARIKKYSNENSFGAISVAFIGLIFIFIGIILTVSISIMGG